MANVLNFGNVGLENVGGPFFTTANVDLYVDNINGDDANDGSVGNPLKTLVEAESRLPLVIDHRVIIHMLPYDVSVPNVGYYEWPVFRARVLNENIFVVSESIEVLATGTAQAGSDQYKLVTTGGLTVDEYVDSYASIYITSGLSVGDRRTISENTATDIVPANTFSDAVAAGDTYEIVRPLVQFVVPEQNGESVLAYGTSQGKGGGFGKASPSLWLINVILEKAGIDSNIRIDNIQVNFFGTVLRNNSGTIGINSFSSILSGYETLDYTLSPYAYRSFTLAAVLPSLCSTDTAVGGWGLSVKATSCGLNVGRSGFDGFFVLPAALTLIAWPITTISQKERSFVYLRGGRINRLVVGSQFALSEAAVHIKADTRLSIPFNEFLIRDNTSEPLIYCLNADVVLYEVDMQNAGSGDAIHCNGITGRVNLYNCQGSAGGVGLRTSGGGVIQVHGSSSFSGTVGDFSEDDGATLRAWATLVADSWFTDSVRGSVICYP